MSILCSPPACCPVGERPRAQPVQGGAGGSGAGRAPVATAGRGEASDPTFLPPPGRAGFLHKLCGAGR